MQYAIPSATPRQLLSVCSFCSDFAVLFGYPYVLETMVNEPLGNVNLHNSKTCKRISTIQVSDESMPVTCIREYHGSSRHNLVTGIIHTRYNIPVVQTHSTAIQYTRAGHTHTVHSTHAYVHTPCLSP